MTNGGVAGPSESEKAPKSPKPAPKTAPKSPEEEKRELTRTITDIVAKMYLQMSPQERQVIIRDVLEAVQFDVKSSREWLQELTESKALTREEIATVKEAFAMVDNMGHEYRGNIREKGKIEILKKALKTHGERLTHEERYLNYMTAATIGMIQSLIARAKTPLFSF